jgi:predicted Zn-dependent peptidase
MKKGLLIFLLLVGASLHPGVLLNAQNIEAREEILPNGMKLLMIERHQSPVITCGWVAKVGSVNEKPGITGISHLFEHMMFKGTKTIGTSDFEKGQEIQDRQDEIRAEMEKEYTKLRYRMRMGEIRGSIYDPENMTPRLRELRAELEELFKEEKQYIVKDELDQIYTSEGASGLNAGTTNDQTLYFINLPANKLELWFWMESDRLLNPVFREFYSERDVVREERRLRVESTPTGLADEAFDAMFWQSSPYSWPVIGWPSDVESISRAQAQEYFDTFYAPDNITAVIVGDFDPDKTLELAREYFGRIPRGKTPPPQMITVEVDQVGEKRYTAEVDTNTRVILRYHTPPFNHADNFPLQLFADSLKGRTGRLYKALVEEKGLISGEPRVSLNELKYGGFFEVSAEVKEGIQPETVEAAILEELEKLKTEPLGERELQRLKNNLLANSVKQLQTNYYLVMQVLFYDSLDSWEYINEAPKKYQVVTADQVMEAAARYINENNRNVAYYLRKEGSDTEVPPELAGLPAELRSQVMQQAAMFSQLEDREKLEGALAQSEQMKGQVPPEIAPAMDYIIKILRLRLEELTETEGGQETGTPEGE